MPRDDRRQRTLLMGATAMLLAVLGVLAYLVLSTQAQSRRDLERRFRDRTRISAAVAEGVFASVGSGSSVPPALMRARIDPAALDRLAAQGRNPYIVVRRPSGAVVAHTTGAPPAATGPVRADLRPAMSGRTSFFTGVVQARGRTPAVIEWGIPFEGRAGRRVEVVGVPLAAMSSFLGDFLGRLPDSSAATAAVVDPAGRLVGSPDRGVRPGRPYADRELVAAARQRSAGNLGDRYFASAPVTGSTWRIVSAAADDELYADVNGSRRTLPWLMLVLLTLVGLAGLLALRRAAAAQAEVYRRTISRRAALEINDNVIQRLAIVKFALERGQEAQTREKVAEALQEAQRLVNQLLGEEGTDAGSLRRTTKSPRDVL